MNKKLCRYEGCSREPNASQGLCWSHYKQLNTLGEMSPLPAGETGYSARARRASERRKRQMEAIVEMEREGKSIDEQMQSLGVTRGKLSDLRCAARANGYDIPRAKPGGDYGNGDPAKWAKFDATMRFACGRCTLRGPSPDFEHQCLGSAADYMRSGNAAGGECMLGDSESP